MSQAAAPESLYVCKEGIADIDSEPEEELSLAISREPAGKLEIKSQFVDLRAKGWSYRRIAKRLKVSKSTLANWSQELKQEIASLRAIELEALQEQYFLLREGRIKLLGGLLKKLLKEAMSRDLATLPTDKLLELLLKYEEALQEEQIEPLPEDGLASLEDRRGTEVDSETIAQDLASLLQRYRTGLISQEQAMRELAMLLAFIKAKDQAVFERKLERIETVLAQRR